MINPEPTNDTTFRHLVKSAHLRLKDHAEYNDVGSAKMAAYACGRAVGYCIAFGTPPDWKPLLDELEAKAGRMGVA
jgi:hypothetical protein